MPKTGRAEGKDTANPVSFSENANYFSGFFAIGARDAARSARTLEKLIEVHGVNGEAIERSRHLSLVMSSIIQSFAFLESNINEVLADAAGIGSGKTVKGLNEEARTAWADLWNDKDFRKKGTLVRYQKALEAVTGPFEKGEEPYRSVNYLRKLRNELVHSKPRYVEGFESSKLAREMRKGRNEPPHPNKVIHDLIDALHERDVTDNPYHSQKDALQGWLSASCAEWAWSAAKTFIDEFAKRTGTRPPYKVNHRFKWVEAGELTDGDSAR